MINNRYLLIPFLLLFLCFTTLKAQHSDVASKRPPALFSNSLTEMHPSPIYTFVEQYFSELQSAGNKKTAERKMAADKFTIEQGNLAAIALLNDSLDTQISLDNKKRYSVSWRKNNKTVMSVSFPAQYELILGKNKYDAENMMKKMLFSFRPTTSPRMQPKGDLNSTGDENIYTESNGYYQVKSLRADHYYTKDRQGYRLLSDKRFPYETLANLTTTGQLPNQLQLNIIHKKYGSRQDTIDIPLNHWVLFCKEEGCTPYFGTEKEDEKSITATLIMNNPSLGYIHLLHFSFPLELLEGMKGTVTATLRTYIPTHNLENLYDDDTDTLRQRMPLFDLSL